MTSLVETKNLEFNNNNNDDKSNNLNLNLNSIGSESAKSQNNGNENKENDNNKISKNDDDDITQQKLSSKSSLVKIRDFAFPIEDPRHWGKNDITLPDYDNGFNDENNH
nr:13532_t:CDS:2 [Entrophospora candida]